MDNNLLILDIIGLKQEGTKYRNSSLTCQVTMGGKKLSDLSLARKDHQLAIPLKDASASIQFNIFPMTNPKNRVGSISIPVQSFLDYHSTGTTDQWFTLFDYLEDDTFDGLLGENDSEAPMIQLRYLVGSGTITTSKYETKKESSPVKKSYTTSTVITTTKTLSKSSTKSSTQASTPVITSETYTVQTLTKDLRDNMNNLKGDLRSEQADTHNYEDSRVEQLAHLENVHNELQEEHINDQVRGKELKRLDKEISSEINITMADSENEKSSLQRQIEYTDELIQEKEPILAEKEQKKLELEEIVAQEPDINQMNLSQAAENLRAENENLKNKFVDSLGLVKNEREEKVKVFNEHADLVNSYNELVLKYGNLLNKIEGERNQAENERNSTHDEIDKEESNKVNLEHYVKTSTKAYDGNKNVTDALREDLNELKQHYSEFEQQISSFIASQTDEISSLQHELKLQADGIASLQRELSSSATKIMELHSGVDEQNAANLNAKLSSLITTLVTADKSRRQAQGLLENAQEGWSSKLKLFEDEASRMSRENANKKHAAEIDRLLTKLDKLNRERNQVANARDRIDARLATDKVRDAIDEGLLKEKEQLTLKHKWATDEMQKAQDDLEELVKLLSFKKDLLANQQEQLEQLRIDIELVRVKITECNGTIADLEAQIQELNLRIEELLRLIAVRDSEIEELQKQLDDRMKRIHELESQLDIARTSYVAIKGDQVDEMLAKYIKNCPVPVKRLGGGFYLFGLRKIYAKILNGKLVVGVGGGYMVIDKFIETYSEQELRKLRRIAKREGVSSIEELNLEAIALGPKSSTGRSPTAKSPTGKSPKGKTTTFSSKSSINGTARSSMSSTTKKVTKGANGMTTTTMTRTFRSTKN
ncbi:unnamed protein product [Moneuplotes crassus]|uniref:GAR domain-containing protein n=1 Tax=Euplotes crassus TaxID=5936 RepID=A0AAD1Y201_EUPCR|nr:unnamed protein product [Moneuplotes crassus]